MGLMGRFLVSKALDDIAASTSFAGTMMEQIEIGHKVRCHKQNGQISQETRSDITRRKGQMSADGAG
jgi:hypothetical protein